MDELNMNKEVDPLYLVKWRNQSYQDSTWEKASTLIDYPDVISSFKVYNKALNKDTRLEA